MSFDYFLKKNNQNREKSLIEYNNRLESVNNSLNKWIIRYGEVAALAKSKYRRDKYNETYSLNPNKININKSKGITIENLFKKYGDMDVAKFKYNDWLRKVTVPILRASKNLC
jgi:hypothetical protein